MRSFSCSLILLLALVTAGSAQQQPLQTVPSVDIKRYAGKWYEIASFPQRFERGCHCTTAEYTLSENGTVTVENRCRRDSVNGKASSIKGKAFVQKNSGNARLKVRFFWPFKAKYWIIDLADDYSYAVVGHPNRKYLWILSRSAHMSEPLYREITQRMQQKGFDTAKLHRTVQECGK